MLRSTLILQRYYVRPVFSNHLYHTSAVTYEEATAVDHSQNYNQRRAAYRRQVSVLRKEYAKEVAEQRAADLAAKEALQQKLTRQRLERQRLKNIRSAQNAIRQEDIRKQREREFEEHLKVMQQKREAKNERFRRARQMVVDELEEEAPLWLTTPEEVDAAFTTEAEQILWARPGGVLGAPNPSLDAHFWQYESHTWHMDRTYKSQKQLLLEDIEDLAYDEANIDKTFWTPERIRKREALEEKARLRAMVNSAGREELLRKQREMLYQIHATKEGEIPKEEPIPDRRLLHNDDALEKEGAKVLMNDPTKFFIFDSTQESNADGSADESSENEYSGPTLGAPIGLRDLLREGSHQGTVFPLAIGKDPKPDTRTEREKKQQEREQRLLAAAMDSKKAELNIELAAEDKSMEDLEPDLDYDTFEWDEDEAEWMKGLDPIADKDIIETPRERRFKEDDIDWVVNELESKVDFYERQFGQEVLGLQRSIQSSLESSGASGADDQDLALESLLLSLPDTELIALSDMHDRYMEGLSDGEFSELAKTVPSLTKDQLKFILEQGSQ